MVGIQSHTALFHTKQGKTASPIYKDTNTRFRIQTLQINKIPMIKSTHSHRKKKGKLHVGHCWVPFSVTELPTHIPFCVVLSVPGGTTVRSSDGSLGSAVSSSLPFDRSLVIPSNKPTAELGQSSSTPVAGASCALAPSPRGPSTSLVSPPCSRIPEPSGPEALPGTGMAPWGPALPSTGTTSWGPALPSTGMAPWGPALPSTGTAPWGSDSPGLLPLAASKPEDFLVAMGTLLAVFCAVADLAGCTLLGADFSLLCSLSKDATFMAEDFALRAFFLSSTAWILNKTKPCWLAGWGGRVLFAHQSLHT